MRIKQINGYKALKFSKDEQRIANLNLRYFELENLVDLKIENAECLSFEDKKRARGNKMHVLAAFLIINSILHGIPYLLF